MYGWSLVITVSTLCGVNLLVVLFELALYIKLLFIKLYKRATFKKPESLEGD